MSTETKEKFSGKIQIRSIGKKKWHGHENDKDFAQPKTISVLVDGNKMRYNIEFSEDEKQFILDVLNVDLSTKFDKDKEHSLWDSKSGALSLQSSTMILDLSDARDYLSYKIALASPLVAPSFEDIESGDYPDATHYIFNNDDDLNKRYGKIQLKNEAMSVYLGMTGTEKKQFLAIQGYNASELSEKEITVKINEFVENKPKEFNRFAAMDKKYKSNLAIIKLLLTKRVLEKDRQTKAIKFFDIVLGANEREAAEYIGMDENQGFRRTLTDKMKG